MDAMQYIKMRDNPNIHRCGTCKWWTGQCYARGESDFNSCDNPNIDTYHNLDGSDRIIRREFQKDDGYLCEVYSAN
jgi:hypothetical protein